jgi:hypothetical protein
MFKFSIFRQSVLSFIAVLSLVTLVRAQSFQTFVSATQGVDNNTCASTTPCRTIARAISEVKDGGEVVIIESGDYAPFGVSKSVTVTAAPGVSAGITSTSAVAIGIGIQPTDVVVLRGLTFRGFGSAATGLLFSTPGTLHIENCLVEGFTQAGIDCFPIVAGLQQVFIKNTTARRNYYGILIEGYSQLAASVRASLQGCKLENNSFKGLTVGNNARATVSDSTAAHNNIGFEAVVNGELNLENCVSSNNNEGVTAISTSVIRVSDSTITDNGTGLNNQSTGGILSRRNNTVEGNTTNGSFSGSFLAK